MEIFINKKDNGMVLKVYLQPGASKNAFAGIYDDPPRLKIKIKAPPIDGAANKELIKFLSKEFNIPKSAISILRGDISRKKDVFLEISGQACSEIVRIINNLT